MAASTLVGWGLLVIAGNSYLSAVNGYRYLISKLHRNQAGQKSQWSVLPPEEFAFFEDACPQQTNEPRIWYFPQQALGAPLRAIGHSATRHGDVEPLYLALFINGAEWHGYPADPENKRQDVPPEPLVENWMATRRLTKGQCRRLLEQLPW